jgi:hypothetical protein
MDELNSRDCVPSFLWNNETVSNYVQEVFYECDNSIVGAARRLKTELSRYFSLPGKSLVHLAAAAAVCLPHAFASYHVRSVWFNATLQGPGTAKLGSSFLADRSI